MNIAQAYERVNQESPTAPVTTLTLEEAAKAVRKMFRHLSGKPFTYPVVETTGNRYTWMRHGEFRVNVSKGWEDLVHLFSHWYYARYIGGRPHSKVHARLERKLRKWAIGKGWMAGALRVEEPATPAPSKDESRNEKIVRRTNQIARLERKIRALTTRLKTARRSLSALERHSRKETGSGTE